MKVTLTAVTACVLPHPFGVELAVGESTPATYIKFSDVLSDRWQEIVRLRQQGIVTMTMAVDAEPVFDDELFIQEMGKIRDNAAAPVTNLAALRAVPQSSRIDRQLRLVESENTLYRFDLGTLVGGETPDDVNDGNWFNLGTVAAVWGLVGEMVAVTPGAAAAVGAVAKMTRIDHVHAPTMGLVGELVALGPDVAAAVGGVNKFAAIAHTHAINTGLAGEVAAVADTAAAGVTNKFARIDHAHKLLATSKMLANQHATNGAIGFHVAFPLAALGAAEGKLWDANCPVKCRIIDVGVVGDAVSGGGTVTLYNGDPSGAGVALTDAIPMAAVGVVSRLGTILSDPLIAANGDLWYKKNAAADAGKVLVTCVPIA
jgi:hypothetical protein